MSRPLLAALYVLSFAAGCAPRPPRAVPAEASRSATVHEVAASPPWLVWTRGEEGGSVETLRVDDAGVVVSAEPGLFITDGGTVWKLAVEPTYRKLSPCDDGQLPVEESVSDRASLVATGKNLPERLVVSSYFERPSGEHDGENPIEMGQIKNGIEAQASVGPYLFLREHQWMFTCGAHGFWSASSVVVDVRTGAIVKLAGDPSRGTIQEARHRFAAMGREDSALASLWPGADPGRIDRVATEPSWSKEGELTWRDVFVAGVPYAFGASTWASYAVDVAVPVPAPLPVADTTMPAAVKRAVAELPPGRRLGGYSR